MGAAIVPNLDSIQDLRVLTGNFNAEYGNFSGGQILVSTRSGANELHGSAFEYLRNTALDARNYFAPGRAEYIRNQFGGTLGGAIRKDKLFYFADYQGTRMVPGGRHRPDFRAVVAGPHRRLLRYRELAHRKRQRPVLGQSALAETGLHRESRRAILHRNLRHFRPMRISRRADSAEAPGPRPPSRCCPIFPRRIMAAISSPRRPTTRPSATTRAPSASTTPPASAHWRAIISPTITASIIPTPRRKAAPIVPGFNALSMGRAQLATLSLTTTFGPLL
jgi:hypothetical protein